MGIKKVAAENGMNNTDTTIVNNNIDSEKENEIMNNDIAVGNNKKKVLISFVGNHDPYSKFDVSASEPRGVLNGIFSMFFQRKAGAPVYTDDDEGAVLTIIRERKPDAVFLFPSARSAADSADNQTEGRAEEIADILSKRDDAPSCCILPLDTDNPADPDKCYKAFKNSFMKMREILERDVEGGLGNCDFIINTTSGTQQMNIAGRLFLNVSGVSPDFLRADNPKFAKNRSERVHTVPQRMEEEMVLLRSIERNLASFHFHSIADSCADLADRSILRERRAFANALKDVFGAYELLDMMSYIEAMKKLESLASAFADSKDELVSRLPHLPAERIADALAEQIAFLRKINSVSESESTHNLTDLFFNMQRAFIRGSYADVLSRFWRLREGVLYIRMRDRGVNVRNLNNESEAVRRIRVKEYGNRIKDYPERSIFCGDIKDCVSMLTDELGDSETKAFEDEFYDKLRKLKNNRNHTLVAHGMLPVNREDAELCIEIGEKLIDLIPGGRRAYESYPFTLERMRTLIDMLKA